MPGGAASVLGRARDAAAARLSRLERQAAGALAWTSGATPAGWAAGRSSGLETIG